MLSDRTRLGGLYIARLSDAHYYGGRAKQFRGRWRRHLTALERGTHPNRYMQNVFNKHGRFDPEIIEVLDTIEKQVVAEGSWLGEHFGQPGCLNLSRRPTNNASRPSAETRAKMSRAQKGKPKNLSEAERQRRRDTTSQLRTPAAIQKMRQALTGRKLSPEHRRNLSANSARKGKPITEAMRQAIIWSNKQRRGWAHSEEARRKVSEAVTGRIWVRRGEQTKRVLTSALETHLSEGWKRGRLAASAPLNAVEIVAHVLASGSVRSANRLFFEDGKNHCHLIRRLVAEATR